MDACSRFSYLLELADRGGPEAYEYAALTEWYGGVWADTRSGRVGFDEIRRAQELAHPAFSLATLQGFAWRRPHGYAGDFEIVDRIYTGWISDDPAVQKWDRYFQSQAAPRAVRNRKEYFLDLLKRLEADPRLTPRVLNVASGPGRDVLEHFAQNPASRLHFECIDLDPDAIGFARQLLAEYDGAVRFTQGNAFHLSASERRPSLVWCAGLFDYLDDQAGVVLCRRFGRLVAPGGEIVIGNFAPTNPTRAYMEFGEWNLRYRTADQLLEMATGAGFAPEQCSVQGEAEGVNLFLHIRVDGVAAV